MGSELSNRNNMVIRGKRVARKKVTGRRLEGRGLFILASKYWREGWSTPVDEHANCLEGTLCELRGCCDRPRQGDVGNVSMYYTFSLV